MTGETLVKTAAKLYGMRDSAKTIFREKYAEKVSPMKTLIKGLAEKRGQEILATALQLAKEVEADAKVKAYDPGVTIMLLAAAAVEIIEPS